MPKVTEAHVEARRKQILDAAFACFARDGFHQTTMKDICAEAGLSPGAVYSYFDGKDEMILTSCIASQQQDVELIEGVMQRDDTIEVLDELAAVFFSRLDRPESEVGDRLSVQLWAEALRQPELGRQMREGLDSVGERFAEIVRRAQERGEINPKLDARSAARTLMSVFFGMVLQRAFDRRADVWSYVEVVKALYEGNFWLADPRKV